MFIDGPRQAVKHARLKRQLVAVLRGLGQSSTQSCATRSQSSACRSFSSTASRRDTQHTYDDTSTDSAGGTEAAKNDRALAGTRSSPSRDQNVRYKHIYPQGRVIGRPGRRQRETSETLQIDSLGKLSKVVVLRDVEEMVSHKGDRLVQPSNVTNALRAQHLNVDVLAKEGAIPLADAISSIEQLRPTESFLEQEAFDKLKQQLDESYNHAQLRAYLRHTNPRAAVPSMKDEHQDDDVRVSNWQPGQSSLRQRIPMPKRVTITSKKTVVIDRILHDAWNVSLYAETQEQGELELNMSKTQQMLLMTNVEVNDNTSPYWHTLLSSSLLAHSVELYPVEGTGVIRINGRRSDTMQAARELVAGVGKVVTLQVSLTEIARASNTSSTLSEYFERIQAKTGTVLEQQSGGSILISAFERANCLYARMAIHQILDISAVGTQRSLISPFSDTDHGKTVNVVTPMSMTHALQREQPLYWSRVISSQRTRNAAQAPLKQAQTSTKLSDAVQRYIDEANKAALVLKQNILNQYKQLDFRNAWSASLGYVLHLDDSSRQTKFAPGVPFTDSILSYLDPVEYQSRSYNQADAGGRSIPYMRKSFIIHLVPTTQSESWQAPPIELHFKRKTVTAKSGHKLELLTFSNMIVRLSGRQLQVQLPHEHTDLQLQQDMHLRLARDGTTSKLHGLTSSLQAYVRAVERKSAGFWLYDNAELVQHDKLAVVVPVSSCFGLTALKGQSEVSCHYGFSHMVTAEEIVLQPREDSRTLFVDWAPSTVLSIAHSHGGKIIGHQREITIKHHPRSAGRHAPSASATTPASMKDLVRSAVTTMRMMQREQALIS